MENTCRAQHGGRWSWAGPFLSLLCAIHCVGTAILAPLVPAAAALVENEWLEVALWATSAVLTGLVVWRARSATRSMSAAFGVALASGAAGLVLEMELLLVPSLVTFAAVQIAALLRQRRMPHVGCDRAEVRLRPAA